MHLHPHLSNIAFNNRWRSRHPLEKATFGAGFLMIALVVPPLPWSLVILSITSVAAIVGARISASSWAYILFVPFSFALLTAIGFLIRFDPSGPGFSIKIVPGALLVVSGLFLRSVAAISCLAFIGWTTPLMELMPAIERIGFPTAVTDLALLVYRFAFITSDTLQELRRAQSWRMVRRDYRRRLNAISMLGATLLLRCMDRAGRLEAGLAARGYCGRLDVLPPERPVSRRVVAATVGLQVSVLMAGLYAGLAR